MSIRTSNKRVRREILYLVDALPLDTPYSEVQISSEKRENLVATLSALFHSLYNSYVRNFIRETIPTTVLSNAFGFIMGAWRGMRELILTSAKVFFVFIFFLQ